MFMQGTQRERPLTHDLLAKMAFWKTKRTRSSFARKLTVFRLKELTMCERMKTDLLRDLALGCAHSRGITELSKAMGAKV